MSSLKSKALIIRLLDRTNEGKVEWEETDIEGVYQASFRSHSVQIARKPARGDPEGAEDIVLAVYNQEGKLIDEIGDPDLVQFGLSTQEAFQLMSKLYETARRYAMGVEQAIDNLLQELNDDIPF